MLTRLIGAENSCRQAHPFGVLTCAAGGRAGDARTSARANWLVKGGDDDDTTGK